MKITNLIPILLIFSITALFGQMPNQTPQVICGQALFDHVIHESYPELEKAFDLTFEQIRTVEATEYNSPITVKVVVHVVWKDAAENLADSIIENQIAILNRDFNRQNPDSANLRAIFKPVAGNPQINFVLDQIIRKNTTEMFAIDLLGGSLIPEVKKTSLGGSDAVDTDKYINIWICNIQPTTVFGVPIGQILGFAFPPNGLDNWPAGSSAPSAGEDGVVLDYRMVGSNNPNTIEVPGGQGNLVVEGRTAVHEVGHYLGLRHIWGDGGFLGPNDCAQTDGVDDTPFASAQSNFDCDVTQNSCEQVEIFYNVDMPDLIENYMDYSSESCMNMFTKGQAALMRNTLMGPRSGLVQTVGTQNLVPIGTVLVTPNPTNGITTIRVDFADKNAVLQVFDAGGSLVSVVKPVSVSGETTLFQVDVTELVSGIYFAKTRMGNRIITSKISVY